MTSMTWIGIPEFEAKLGVVGKEVDAAVARGLYEEALMILHAANIMCPVRFGALRATGHVVPPVKEGGEWVAEIAYGGPAAPYAIYVHEIMTAHHQPPTQAKWLETAVLAAESEFLTRLGARVAAILGA